MSKHRWGIGHPKDQQFKFKSLHFKQNLSHGGSLRRKRKGRGFRPLSSRNPIHLVLKVNRTELRHRSLRSLNGFKLIHLILKKYAHHFHVRVEQVSIQHDHIHFLIRTTHRFSSQNFFRVLSGQIAQCFQKYGLTVSKQITNVTDTLKSQKKFWVHRPFTRVVIGFKAYKIVSNYIQLNEKEVTGVIKYYSLRLRGLSERDWVKLWS